MKKLILTLTTVIFVNFSYSQCDNPRVIEFTNGSTATYTGDMDDDCKPEGEGKLVYNDPDYFLEYKSGTFKNGMLNGNGIVVYRNGIYFEGTYIDNEIVNGIYIQNFNSNSLNYKGDFISRKFHGKGTLVKETNLNLTTQEGEFTADAFISGFEISKSKIDGIEIKSKYKNGIGTVTYRNDINSYNKDDILGDAKFIEISLIQSGSKFDARIVHEVELEINGIKGNWILDTGAMSFRIGKTLFNRLVSQGISFTDLNKKTMSMGIGGSSNEKLVILDEVKIGDYIVKNVVATIALDDNNSLLGTGFLLKFDNAVWNMKENKLFLYK